MLVTDVSVVSVLVNVEVESVLVVVVVTEEVLMEELLEDEEVTDVALVLVVDIV